MLEVSILLSLLTLAAILLSRVPFGRWAVDCDGHRIVIWNRIFDETIWVDGVAQKGTRTGGNHLTYAEHRVVLPSGRALRVWIGASSGQFTCRVDDGAQVLFQSDGPPVLEGTPLDTPSDLAAAAASEDPRLPAARVLLADIAAVDREGASALERSLEALMRAEAAARRAADAHSALGGQEGDAARLLQVRAAATEEVLATLRSLHLAVMDPDRDALARSLDAAREVAARLSAAQEIEATTRSTQRQALRAASRQAGS